MPCPYSLMLIYAGYSNPKKLDGSKSLHFFFLVDALQVRRTVQAHGALKQY